LSISVGKGQLREAAMDEPRDRRAEDKDELAARAAAREEFMRAATELVRSLPGQDAAVCSWAGLEVPLDRALTAYRRELATNALRRQVRAVAS
jgi:hypothetical protein